MKFKERFSLLKHGLLHFLVFCTAINLYDSIEFLSRGAGDHISLNADGTRATLAQRLYRHNFLRPDMLYLLLFTLMVELNYRYLFRRRGWMAFAGGSLVSSLLMLAFYQYVEKTTISGYLEPVTVLLCYQLGYVLLREFLRHRLYRLTVSLSASENEVQSLRQQLNPHFLFNTLNYLYGTALREKAESTAEGIDILSGMMRYTVTGMQETFVPLAEEVRFIEQYLYLQQVRLPAEKASEVEVKIDAAGEGLLIAPMLIIPLVENAFKYGVSMDEPGKIVIEIRLAGNRLTATVSNPVPQRSERVDGTRSGLELTRKRLALLYPGKHDLQIARDENSYRATLSLSLTHTSNP